MTLRTWAFAISFLHAKTPVAHALICPDARYVAVRWQDGRLDRRHVPDLLWPSLEQELGADLAGSAISRSSMISTVLVGSMGGLMFVEFVESHTVRVDRKEDAANVLDAATRATQPLAR